MVQLDLHHGIGDVSLHVAHQLLDNSVLILLLGGLGFAVQQLVAQALLELLQRLELGHVLGKLVVHHGGLVLLDLLDLHLEDHGLSGQVRHIVLGEGDVQLLLVAGFQSHDLLLEAGDKGTRAQLQAVIFSLTAFEGHAVVKALKVDDGGVPVLGFPVHADQAGGAGDVGLELVLNVLVSDGRLSLGGGEALVLAQLHLGTDGRPGP